MKFAVDKVIYEFNLDETELAFENKADKKAFMAVFQRHWLQNKNINGYANLEAFTSVGLHNLAKLEKQGKVSFCVNYRGEIIGYKML